MARYITTFDGDDGFEVEAEHDCVEKARDAAVVLLGKYLQDHPAFAYERHWRVDVFDEGRRLLLHVIVATVDSPKPLIRASYDTIDA